MSRYRVQPKRISNLHKTFRNRPASSSNVIPPLHLHLSPQILVRVGGRVEVNNENRLSMSMLNYVLQQSEIANAALLQQSGVANTVNVTAGIETAVTRLARETMTRVMRRSEHFENTDSTIIHKNLVHQFSKTESSNIKLPVNVEKVYRRNTPGTKAQDTPVAEMQTHSANQARINQKLANSSAQSQPPVDIQRIADRVIENIDRRIIAQRERLGRS
jgi:hypothetical protein